MQIVIEIDNEHYERIMRLEEDVTVYPTTLALYEAVKNGTPLPKGHGDLKDAERLLDSFSYEYCRYGDFGYRQAENLIKSSLTIIEADGGEEDEDSN